MVVTRHDSVYINIYQPESEYMNITICFFLGQGMVGDNERSERLYKHYEE